MPSLTPSGVHDSTPHSPPLRCFSIERRGDVGPTPSPPGLNKSLHPRPRPCRPLCQSTHPRSSPFAIPNTSFSRPQFLLPSYSKRFRISLLFFCISLVFCPQGEDIPGSEDSPPLCEPKGTEPYEIQWSTIVPLSTPRNYTQGPFARVSTIGLRCVHSMTASFISVFSQRRLWLMDRQPRRSASPDPRPSWMPTAKIFNKVFFYVDNHINLLTAHKYMFLCGLSRFVVIGTSAS